ncbi:hypothetical protein GH714_037746 [Hevea brasiliensis]|uniref:BRCT domain-containing protein n=1 Tax=Hevea brasiliensis TaxID=3981 RepID=A0A6A6K8F2_HEVBR|nr:hypothetical protein GH714_037746 [Hevea brasiliensis]
MGGSGKVEVITSKGCSRMFMGFSASIPSFRGLQSFEPMSPFTSSVGSEPVLVRSSGPFAGLVICVTGLSKEARKQVMEATERLGGQYSPNLHPQCTHLVVQISFNCFGGRKFEHALKHGSKNGLFVVALGWFVDSVRRNVRLSESLYSVKSVGENDVRLDDLNRLVGLSGTENSCLPVGFNDPKKFELTEGLSKKSSVRSSDRSIEATLSGNSLYVDSDISDELRNKVYEAATREGATFWIDGNKWGNDPQDAQSLRSKASYGERQQVVNFAKNLVRSRGRRMQTCQTPIRPITPSSLLDSICWSISEPTSTASIYTDSLSCDDVSEHHTSVFFDAKGDKDSEASFANLTRPLTESEKTELVFKNHFLTILFPTDRFSEMGPYSRTFFSKNGFTCLQVLDHIYAFYQENMSASEIEAAIHTDSRHADRLRSVYSSKETAELGYVIFKRIDFLGSRKSFEMLKRVAGDNNSNVYELLIRA